MIFFNVDAPLNLLYVCMKFQAQIHSVLGLGSKKNKKIMTDGN